MLNIKKIPVASPFLGEKEADFVGEAVNAGEISGNFGKYIGLFEEGFARYCGVQRGISTNNGTTALHLALAALNIGPGHEVLVSTFTNMAPIFSICYTGAKPVPVDIEEDTWNIDPSLIERKITNKTKAILVVHIYGHPVDMDPIMEIAKKHDLYVIEDCAEAHGAEYKGKKVGSFGDISTFSFYANKIITTGEGGMVVTNNNELADRARSFGSLSYGKKGQRFMHSEIGFNYRMSNIVAAIGYAQLDKIDKVIEMKRKIASIYTNNLKNLDIQLPTEKEYAKNVYWMYHVCLKNSWAARRKYVMEELFKRGIETREAFVPFNQQEIFLKTGLVKQDECPVANNVGANGFYIPSGPLLSAEDQEYVIQNLREILKQKEDN